MATLGFHLSQITARLVKNMPNSRYNTKLLYIILTEIQL